MSQRRPYILIYNKSNYLDIIIEQFKEINSNSIFSEYTLTDDILKLFSSEPDKIPDIIIFNLGDFSVEAKQLLKDLKNNSSIRHIPLIILSLSDKEADVILAYDNYANSYIVKSLKKEQMINIVNSIASFWLNIVRFPSSD